MENNGCDVVESEIAGRRTAPLFIRLLDDAATTWRKLTGRMLPNPDAILPALLEHAIVPLARDVVVRARATIQGRGRGWDTAECLRCQSCHVVNQIEAEGREEGRRWIETE